MKKVLLGTAVGLSALAIANVAQALPIYHDGSFAFAAFTSTTSNVATTKTFAVPTAKIITGSPVGSFTLAPLPSQFTVSPVLDFTTPTSAAFDFSDPGIGTFDAMTVTLLGAQGGKSAFAAWDVRGTFTLGSDWMNAGKTLSADETWALTQTGGPGNAISMSGTFHAPALGVPEPATIALAGAALLALGLRRRK
jgi:hypothetical protein